MTIQVKIFIALTALLLTSTNLVQAQTKVAHINSQKLIGLMPEMQAAKVEFEELQQSLEADIAVLMKEYETKEKEYYQVLSSETEDKILAREQELVQLRKQVREAEAAAQATIEQKYTELTQPIQEKALAAIQKVARAQGFTYVLDATDGGGLLLSDGKDLLEDVKKELGF